MRGVLHAYAFFAALGAGSMLVVAAESGRARLAAAIYALGLAGLLGTSALYHRVTWRPRARRWMRRLDHSMIFVLIAATYTPFAVLVISGPLGYGVLTLVWAAAGLGIFTKLIWLDAPKWLMALLCSALGWVGLAVLPELAREAG